MVAKSKKNKDPEIQHLSELQHSELPRVVWEFLLKQAGDSEIAFGLKPRQIKDYADDFLFSDEGRFYWPLSSLSQWQYESTEEEVKKWIAELMTSERKKKHDEDSHFKFDDPLQSSSAKKPSTLRKSHLTWTKKATSGAPRTMTGEGSTPKRTPGFATNAPFIPSRSNMSPTVVPDVPYEEPSETPQSTPLKSTRSTPASITIADDRSPGTGGNKAAIRGENRPATLGIGLNLRKSPITPRKRPAEDDGEDRPDSSGISFPDLRYKRAALDSLPSPQKSPKPSSAHLGEMGASLGASRDESNSMMPPPKREQQNSELSAESNSQSSRLQTVNAYGLPYTIDKLSKVPERVLDYITECIHHEIRLAEKTGNIASKDGHRSRSTLLQNLHADIKSRIQCLAEDAEGKRRVESSHCLWN